MTQAEYKVKELAEKMVKRIDELRKDGFEDSDILASLRNYLLGLTDGLGFSAEMNENKKSHKGK